MWSSTHIQGHRGRIGSTGIASLSTALAPPSLAYPPSACRLRDCTEYDHKKAFTLFPSPHIPHVNPLPRYRVRDEIPTLFCEEYFPGMLHPQSSWARDASEALLPLYQQPHSLAVMMHVCVRTYVRASPHSFSGIRGVTYLGTYLTSNRLLLR